MTTRLLLIFRELNRRPSAVMSTVALFTTCPLVYWNLIDMRYLAVINCPIGTSALLYVVYIALLLQLRLLFFTGASNHIN
jgi:hypothetical protein